MGDVEKGKKLFTQRCAQCHSVEKVRKGEKERASPRDPQKFHSLSLLSSRLSPLFFLSLSSLSLLSLSCLFPASVFPPSAAYPHRFSIVSSRVARTRPAPTLTVFSAARRARRPGTLTLRPTSTRVRREGRRRQPKEDRRKNDH